MKWLELRIPPPVVALIFAGAMAVCARAVPMLSVPFPRHEALAFAVALLGLGIDVSATRNPMYVGPTLLLTAWGLYLSNALALGLVAGFVT